MKQESPSGFSNIRARHNELGRGAGVMLDPGEPGVNPFALPESEKVEATSFGDKFGQWMTLTGGHTVICPDLFSIRHLGEADNLRGKIVRAFAAILDKVWPV